MNQPTPVVRSAVVIDATPHVVWRNVVSFPDLPPPQHWLFRTGVAFPLAATIDGRGPGAVRKCTFSTGSFIEPIEVWDEPHILRFSVVDNPPPMEEWSIYENLHPPHLDGYFVSEAGQFQLTPLAGGGTRLEGSTWYRHNMRPGAYWRLWSNFMIHRIHFRVLHHVKGLSERSTTRSTHEDMGSQVVGLLPKS